MEQLSARCKEPIEAPEHVIERTLRAAVNVHRELGPGLAEKVYEAALLMELEEIGLRAITQVPVPVFYKGKDLGIGFRADIVVEDSLLLELKAVDSVADVHMTQTINYLHLLGLKRGFILNFDSRLMKDGIQRVSI